MDILAHALWSGAGLAVVHRRWPIALRTAVATVALATLSDVAHMLPMLAWSVGGMVRSPRYGAIPLRCLAKSPMYPPMVAMLSHHLHCTLHSAIVAGWWSHIMIDIFTLSADFYPAPVLDPITQRGFDGIAWNTPWFMVLNYSALAGVGLWLWLKARHTRRRR